MNTDDLQINPLARAIALAAEAHLSHLDKAGKPYILHPLRVMFSLGKVPVEEQIAAVLHDVVKDSSWTLEELEAEGFSACVIHVVDCLTRRKAESYGNYIRRVSKSPAAARIKLEDLKDNADLGRFDHPTQADVLRSEKYRNVGKKLYELLGDPIVCLKQENQYGHCFDYMFMDVLPERKTLQMFLRDYGMEVVNEEPFRSAVLRLLETLHEQGIVRPIARVVSEESIC